jgi:hypothetical protein
VIVTSTCSSIGAATAGALHAADTHPVPSALVTAARYHLTSMQGETK